ncbi:D-alanyl-lipoteichoic acid biosynthesis protein DltD, partial [Lactococcus fujiensis]|uniref:D-alanyl-lipoteichoic acid biosynthesis protein DltD n=1 Tax=Lactococcus fujiensis TaxID=610251 RepID=UPI0015DE0AC7
LLIFLPFNVAPKYSKQELNEFAADPSNRLNFIGYTSKEQSFANKDYLPILGSSELEHVNPFHPTSFFMRYPDKYVPYLIGMPGTSSLTHYFYLNSVSNELKNRKIVFIISPQWFTQRGINESAFEQFISKGEIYAWMKSANPNTMETRVMAQRLLEFKGAEDDALIANGLRALADGKKINPLSHLLIDATYQIWKKEDTLFSGISTIRNKNINVLPKMEKTSQSLPKIKNVNTLDKMAVNYAENTQDNNPFDVNNRVWLTNLGPRWKKLKGYQDKVSYLSSPEFTDFQALLNFFAQNHDQVQFIIQPVNDKWYRYTGLSMPMMKDFSKKITSQLRSQGFNEITDFTDQYNTPYFIGDTDHFGSVGWLQANLAIQKFMNSKSNYDTDYKINNEKFMSKEWQTTTKKF